MPDRPDRPKPQSREERLAAALRENLKRRKEQARARTASDPEDFSRTDKGQDGASA